VSFFAFPRTYVKSLMNFLPDLPQHSPDWTNGSPIAIVGEGNWKKDEVISSWKHCL